MKTDRTRMLRVRRPDFNERFLCSPLGEMLSEAK